MSKCSDNACCGGLSVKLADENQCCGSKVVKVQKPWHISYFLMNVNEPGTGTYYSACCCVEESCVCCNLFVGWLQEVLAGFVIGHIWSIKWGVSLYFKAD